MWPLRSLNNSYKDMWAGAWPVTRYVCSFIINNEHKNKSNIFDLVLNQIGIAVYLVCTKLSSPAFESHPLTTS